MGVPPSGRPQYWIAWPVVLPMLPVVPPVVPPNPDVEPKPPLHPGVLAGQTVVPAGPPQATVWLKESAVKPAPARSNGRGILRLV
jgi:hypothetical protein